MSATPTEAERQKAYEVWNEALCNSGIPGWHHADAFAQALADQRDRHEAVVALRVAQALADQRVRYEALADELDGWAAKNAAASNNPNQRQSSAYQLAGMCRAQEFAADRIRQVAQ